MPQGTLKRSVRHGERCVQGLLRRKNGTIVTFKTGDTVLISFQGQSAAGEIFMASDSSLSLTLAFDACLGIYHGLMPVLWMEGIGYVDLMEASPVVIVPCGPGE